MKYLWIWFAVAAALFGAAGAKAQGLNVNMPLGSACPAGYHWEMAGGFAQCLVDVVIVPPPPPSGPGPACKYDWTGLAGYEWDIPGSYIWIGFYDIQSPDAGGRPGMRIWYDGVLVYEQYGTDMLPLDINNPDTYIGGTAFKQGEAIKGDVGNGNGTAWMVWSVCKK